MEQGVDSVSEKTSMILDKLPEGCISHILSLTTPKDTCVSAAVSTVFRSAAESDSVWMRFLPSDYQAVLSRSVDPINFSSIKDLFFGLCNPLLIDEGEMSFVLEKSTGYKCYRISAKKLDITWGDTPRYWRWPSHPHSRFSEVAELVNVCWFSVGGTLRSGELQANTIYVVYLIYRLTPLSNGFETMYEEANVTIADQVICDEIVYLESRYRRTTRRGSMHWRSRDKLPRFEEVKYFPKVRDDEWMEVGLGEFLNECGGEEEIKILLKEIECGHWKSGLIVEGIEFRPKRKQ